jgi:branched-chain amino acid transport system permease protein/urea transport system permease protein
MRDGRVLANILAWGMLLAGPFVVDDWQLAQLSQLVSYGIFAMSLAFLWGQVGLLCFGQAVFFGIGGYAMAIITKGMLPGVPSGAAVGLLAAAIGPAILGCIGGLLLFRGRSLSGAYFAIVTLSTAAIVELVASHWEFIGGFNGLMNVPPLRIILGGRSIELLAAMPVYYAMLAAAGLVYAVLAFLERSPLGTVLRAIRDNEQRTAHFGYDVSVYKTFGFTVSATAAGLAGGLFVTQFGFVAPSLIGVSLSTEVLIWTALGGREVLLAAFLGAIIVRSVEGLLSETLGYYWLLALGLMFVATVVFFPRGLLGWALQLPLSARLTRGVLQPTTR